MNLYSPQELREMPTLASGQTANLKIDTGTLRVWLCRVTNEVIYERLINGRWTIVNS
jgi:hypothetical protein